MEYSRLFGRSRNIHIPSPDGMSNKTKYVFSVTYTNPDTVKYDALADSLAVAIRKEGATLAAYPHPQGDEKMREMISEQLHSTRGINESRESIFLSTGASGAIRCIFDAFIDPGDTVFVEEFTYMGSLNMLLERQANIIHVATDQDGMDTNALEIAIQELLSRNGHPKLIHTISLYQNPMGMNLSMERRRHLLEISSRYGIPILENESYANFRIDGSQLPSSLYAMDSTNSVIYVSSYTKLVGCGLGVGYAVVPQDVKPRLAELDYGGAPSHLSVLAIREFMMTHAEEYIATVVESLKNKRNAMLEALNTFFPSTATWNHPEGGMMIWVRLPESADTLGTLGAAIRADVKYNPGSVFRATKDGNNFLRLTYSHNSPAEIREGVSILGKIFEEAGSFQGQD